jgi:hypothetical protein
VCVYVCVCACACVHAPMCACLLYRLAIPTHEHTLIRDHHQCAYIMSLVSHFFFQSPPLNVTFCSTKNQIRARDVVPPSQGVDLQGRVLQILHCQVRLCMRALLTAQISGMLMRANGALVVQPSFYRRLCLLFVCFSVVCSQRSSASFLFCCFIEVFSHTLANPFCFDADVSAGMTAR